MGNDSMYRDEHCAVDFLKQAAFLDNETLTLTRKEFELLATLARNAGDIVPRDVLLQNIWGYSREIRTRTLDVHIRRLRKKLNPYGEQYIETIFGVGYRFQPYREPRQFFSAVA
jgi:DNA-binding response OmpR family regulator